MDDSLSMEIIHEVGLWRYVNIGAKGLWGWEKVLFVLFYDDLGIGFIEGGFG